MKHYKTRRMYWRRASIQDGQAPGDATVLKRFFCDNFVMFRLRSKRIAFLESVNFSTCDICKCSIFVMVTWPLFGTFQGPISAKCLITDSPDSKKAHHQSLGFPLVPLVWGKTVSSRLCAGQSKGTLKHEKCCYLDLAPPTLQNSEIFLDSTRPHLHFDGLPPKSRRSVVSI